MLSELQERILEAAGRLEDAGSLALAGGAALIVRGLVDRTTQDLDLFVTSSDEVGRVAIALEDALTTEDLAVHRVRESATFVRLEVSSGDERCIVDVGVDARVLPVEPASPIATVAEDELAADKVLALFDRAEARDFVDVHALVRVHGRERLLELAALKDRGFSWDVFAEMLGTIDRLGREEFEVDDDTLDELRRSFAEWRRVLRGD